MKGLSISVSVKLWAFAWALAAVSLGKRGGASGILIIFALLQLGAQQKWRAAVSCGIFCALLGALLYGIRYHGLQMRVFSEFYVLMFWNLSPVILVSWDLITTPPGNLSAFLSRLRAPASVILGALVLFRFFPTMKAELKSVKLSMKNRGLTDFKFILRHPAAACEYVLIPFLLRVLMTADQLSVSAVARGAEYPGVRGSYYGEKLRRTDLAIAALWSALSVVFLRTGGFRI